MKKRILYLMMAVLIAISVPLTASAASTTNPNEKEWTVRYDGDKMNTEIGGKAATVDLTMPTQLPGGEFMLDAKIHNDSKYKTDWYMSNEILKSLEKSVAAAAAGGAYTYLLTYHGPEENGVTPAPIEIYNSSSVGGDTASAGGEVGLEEVKDLKEHFYLDRLLPGEKASVKLYVALDGTTLTNSYQDSMAELQLNFAVEKIREGTITKEITRINTETLVEYVPTVVQTMVQTGDNAPILLFSGLTFVSAIGLIVVAVRIAIKRRSEKGELQ